MVSRTISRPLTRRGEALVELTVRVATRIHGLRELAGEPPIQAQHFKAVIDTGATMTVFRAEVLVAFGVASTGFTSFDSISSAPGSSPCPTFELWLGIRDEKAPFVIGDLQVAALPFSSPTVDALVGTDVLSKCKYTHDGRAGMFTLEF